MSDPDREPPESTSYATAIVPDGGTDAADGLTVVLAVSGADVERAPALVDAVADLAGPLLAEVHVVNAFSPDDFETALERLHFDPDAPPEPTDVATRTSAVRDVIDRLEDEPGAPRVDVHGIVDDTVGAAIVAFADEVGADRVFVGGRKRSPAGKAVFGSTAQHVLLNATAPVTFVRD
jgi:nucleotide-binding universal stress UspA family protein